MTVIGNPRWNEKAVDGALADFRRAASPSHINEPLFKLSCRLLELAHAGALDESEAERLAGDEARALGHAPASIRDTWRSALRRTAGKAAVIPEPASTNGHAGARGPQGYRDLAAYAQAHGVPVEAFQQAGWTDAVLYEAQGGQGPYLTDRKPHKPLRQRRALRFTTDAGPRYRLIDGEKGAKYWHPTGAHQGDKRRWYGLPKALALAGAAEGAPLVLCNGEASTVAAQHYGVPACAEAGGGEKVIPDHLLAELLKAWPGEFLIAFEGDTTGRGAAEKKVAQLRAAGREARAVDLGLVGGEDLADFCQLHQADALSDLLSRPELAAPAEQPSERPKGLRLVPAAELGQLPPVEWLVEGELPKRALAVLYGPSGAGKSFVALDLAARVAQGRPVAYLAGEGASGYHSRLSTWRSFHQADAGALSFVFDAVNLLNDSCVDELIAALNPHQPALVVIDTLAQTMIGGDENSARDMGLYLASCRRLIRELGATVLLVHHTGKNGASERGSSALRGAADVMIELSSEDGAIRLECSKMKDARAFDSRYLTLKTHGESCVIVPATMRTDPGAPMSPAQVKILEVLALSIFEEKGAKTTQIADAAGLAIATLYRALSALKTRGYISQGAKGDPYYLTSIGRAALGPEYLLSPETAHQDAQLSPLSTNYHQLSQEYTTDSLSLSHSHGSDSDSRSESQREKRADQPLASPQGYQTIPGYGDDVPAEEPPRLGAALWREQVVIVEGYHAEAGADGRCYATIAGSAVGAPVDELAWPRRAVDLNLVRRCLATDNRLGAERHLALCGWHNHAEALLALLDQVADQGGPGA